MHGQSPEAEAVLEPHLAAALARIPQPRFSTKRVIAALRSSAEGAAAYEEALGFCGEGPADRMAYLVLHGQVVPELLRHSGLVRFAGFIHGEPEEDDGYSVPSWWRKV